MNKDLVLGEEVGVTDSWHLLSDALGIREGERGSIELTSWAMNRDIRTLWRAETNMLCAEGVRGRLGELWTR